MNSTLQFSRRQFLQGATVAGTAGTLSLITVVESDGGWCKRRVRRRTGTRTRSDVDHVRDLAYSHFDGLIGDSFVVAGSPNIATQHEATLILVDVLRHPVDDDRPPHVRQEAFSLLFIAREGEEIPNETHWVRHPRLFRMALFLHETRRDDFPHHKSYVAVFN